MTAINAFESDGRLYGRQNPMVDSNSTVIFTTSGDFIVSRLELETRVKWYLIGKGWGIDFEDPEIGGIEPTGCDDFAYSVNIGGFRIYLTDDDEAKKFSARFNIKFA